jgi:hypothetical protein
MAATVPTPTPDAAPAAASPPAPPAPRGVAWLDVETAARRTGWSRRHVTRLCFEKWYAAGLARQDGARAWQIREDADPLLARCPSPETKACDLQRLPAAQRRDVLERVAVLEEWKAAKAAAIAAGMAEKAATAEFLRALELGPRGLRVSRATHYNWLQLYTRDGVGGLADGRWRAKRDGGDGAGDGGADDADPFFAELRRHWLHPNAPPLTVCHDITTRVAELERFPARSYWQCLRYVRSLPAAYVTKMRRGDKAFTDEAEPSIKRDYSTLASNEIWCADDHRLDVMVKLPGGGGGHGRPWLHAWEDLRSRKIVGWTITVDDVNMDTVLATFRAAALQWGVPQRVYCDNGRNYLAYALAGRTRSERFKRARAGPAAPGDAPPPARGIFAALGVELVSCQPYNGRSKPIERAFGTLASRFCRTFPTYCGKSPADRPAGLEERLKRGEAPDLAGFVDLFGRWLASDYNARGHRGDAMDGKTPDAVYVECLHSKRTAPAELLDLLMQQRSQPVKVTRHGVTWQGIGYGSAEPLLFDKLGQEVCLGVDPRDLSRVSVWTTDDAFLCYASANVRLPFTTTKEDLRAAKKALGHQRREYKGRFGRQSPLLATMPELLVDASVERARREAPPDPTLPPPSIEPVRSPLEDQLPAVRRALAARKAVGAERFHYDLYSEENVPEVGKFTYDRRLDRDLLSAALERISREEEAAAEQQPDAFGVLTAAMNSQREADHV